MENTDPLGDWPTPGLQLGGIHVLSNIWCYFMFYFINRYLPYTHDFENKAQTNQLFPKAYLIWTKGQFFITCWSLYMFSDIVILTILYISQVERTVLVISRVIHKVLAGSPVHRSLFLLSFTLGIQRKRFYNKYL